MAMLQKINEDFLRESDHYHFAGCCEQCAHFDGSLRSCSFFWPNEAHLATALTGPVTGELSFCKDFELN